MSGINTTLNIAKGALAAQQYGLSVAGHNIANVDTPSFSRQRLTLTTSIPIQFGGLTFGTGVDAESITRSTNESLETRLAQERSNLSAYEGAETYINIIENYFNEGTESSISNLSVEFWNAWQDMANNPSGLTERGIVVEKAGLLTERLNTMSNDLESLDGDISQEILAQLNEVSSITSEIATVNQEVVRLEISGQANDQRDKRNALVNDLSELIGIHTFEQEDGALNITTANGFSLVNGTDSYSLRMDAGQVLWEGSYGATTDITSRISGGRVGGLLEVRDQVLAKYRTELDDYAREFIWAVNQQHSQGVGLNYFSVPVTGTYRTDASSLLDTLDYGNQIDYAKDFKLWIEDNSTSVPAYNDVDVDMGISDAVADDWIGTAPEESEFKYVFTVTDGGTVDVDGNVVVTDGPALGTVQTGADATAALDAAIADQTISVFGGEAGTQEIDVADGGDAERSAAAIAAALNQMDGVTASAFENRAVLDISNLFTTGVTELDPNDRVSFTLSSGTRSSVVSFRAGTYDYETLNNFQTALDDAIADINNFGNDLAVEYSGNTAVLTSAGGENIGVADFNVEDLPVATLGNFQNLGVDTVVGVDNFSNFAVGENVDFSVTTAQGTVNMTYTVTDDTNQTTLADDFDTMLTASAGLLAGIGVATVRVGDSFTFTGNASAGYIDFGALSAGPGGDESFDITAGAGTGAFPATGDNVLTFDGTGDLERYAGDNTVNFTVNGTDNITVDLRRVDTTDAAAVAQAFFNGLDTNVTNAFATLVGSTVRLTSLDESASDLSFTAGTETVGVDGSFDITVPGGTLTSADNTFTLDGADGVAYTSVANTDTIQFEGATLTESGGAGDDSAVKTSTATIILEPGISILSTVAGAAGGIFNIAANAAVTPGATVLTLGGDGAYTGFDSGNRVSFFVDGTYVNYIVGAADDTDPEYAAGLEAALNAAGLGTNYDIRRHGSYVSILKMDGTDIDLTNFADDGFGGGTVATLEAPANGLIMANNAKRNSASSRLFGDRGVISWEKFVPGGRSTGQRGSITIADEGPFEVEAGGLSFTIGPGDLVAGNTFTLNTNSLGQADPLEFRATGTANSVRDTYVFTVDPEGGGEIGADDVTVNWTNSVSSGSFVLRGQDPPYTPVTANLDGMRLYFDGGTVFDGDVFTMTTDANGNATVHQPSDWHWTMESFADQFNRQALGVKADITDDNKIRFSSDENGIRPENMRYTGSDGFCPENIDLEVSNYEALTREWPDMRITRDATRFASTGGWGISGFTNPGYDVQFVPMDGFDLDNGFYVELDGVRALALRFDAPISDDGALTLNLATHSGDFRFAFSDDATEDSGMAAALGVNTFFTGYDAMTARINSVVSENRSYIAAARIDADTGTFSAGDNTNALAIADQQYERRNISEWNYDDGGTGVSTTLNSTLEDYYSLMIGSLGVNAQSIRRGAEFSQTMLNQISDLRDTVSAVSLDEEMINVMKFQHAFTVASKLLKVSDEMLETLVNLR